MDVYRFRLPPSLSIQMYDKMQEGQREQYIKDGDTYTGTERGGNFEFNNENNVITATNIHDAPTSPETSSLDTGDYPFTFHSHPVIVKRGKIRLRGGNTRRKGKGGAIKASKSAIKASKSVKTKPPTKKEKYRYVYSIDNYPNFISDDDLIGCVEDSVFSNIMNERELYGSDTPTTASGVNIFDIIAAPYGLFVYRPSKEFLLTHDNSMDKVELSITTEFENYKDTILPSYSYALRKNYYDSVKGKEYIENYIQKLQKHGFRIEFFSWKDAKSDEISITLNDITEQHLLPTRDHSNLSSISV